MEGQALKTGVLIPAPHSHSLQTSQAQREGKSHPPSEPLFLAWNDLEDPHE